MIDGDIEAFACFCRCLRGDLLVFCLWLELSGDPGSNDQPITGVCVACIGTQSRGGNRVRVFPGPRSVPAGIQSAIPRRYSVLAPGAWNGPYAELVWWLEEPFVGGPSQVLVRKVRHFKCEREFLRI